MWRLKQLIPTKDQANLEGKSVDVGNFKLQIRSIIAEGGFSSVYLAKDPLTGKQYAVKHIICNDDESLDLVRKEISVMKFLRGHPNVVMLHTQAMYDMGRTKECFLVMDHCEKTLVHVLDARGAGYFEEKQLLQIFLDVCNAVYALHCHNPPIAHRDLKAENVLLGPDGLWKLCDFGSTSTTHKRFEKPGEMGVEEDVIRKHTTPAYRAPEMWDLYTRELISEKVDIWALGCLLYRMAYLKSAFDGESKLQILNGNYKIPDLPRYSAQVTELIKDMLTLTPESRPDVLQVWHRVNKSLPHDCQKPMPDKPSSLSSSKVEPSTNKSSDARISNPTKSAAVLPSRAPPPVPVSRDTDRFVSQSKGGASAGSFWSSQYAEGTFDTGRKQERSPVTSRDVSPLQGSGRREFSPPVGNITRNNVAQKSSQKSLHIADNTWDQEHDKGVRSRETAVPTTVFQQDEGTPKSSDLSGLRSSEVSNSSKNTYDEILSQLESPANTTRENINQVVEDSHVDLEGMREALRRALAEKDEIAAKYEKLTAICRSQRQEIQDLKSALKVAMNREASLVATKSPASYSQMQPAQQYPTFDQGKPKQAGSIWDLQEGSSDLFSGGQGVNDFKWEAFAEPAPHATHSNANTRSQTRGYVSETSSIQDSKAFVSFSSSATSTYATDSDKNKTKDDRGRRSVGRSDKPAGWAGF